MPDEPTDIADATADVAADVPSGGGVLVDEVLVEEVSIDGMCGVY